MSSPIDGVSVVVPTYNRRDRLERVLGALAKQDLDVDIEVVVVSDGSSDGTNEYLRAGDTPLPVVAVIQDNGGPSRARNAGIDRASHDLVVFVDDDVVLESGALAAHVAAHRRLGENTVVIGPMLDPVDYELSAWVEWEQRQLAKQYDAMNEGKYDATCRQFYTGNASVRRRHLTALGGFDPMFRRAEDVELAFRMDDAGLMFHFAPEAVGRHYAERSFESWRDTARVYGRNDIVFSHEQGRGWVSDMIVEGFHDRPVWARAVIGAAVRYRPIEWCALSLGTLLARNSDRLPDGVAQKNLSMVYAIDYGLGVADELGSRRAFVDLVRSPHPPTRR